MESGFFRFFCLFFLTPCTKEELPRIREFFQRKMRSLIFSSP